MKKLAIATFACVVLSGCIVAPSAVVQPAETPLATGDVAINLCAPLLEGQELPPNMFGIYTGVVDHDPVFNDHYMRYEVTLNVTDSAGEECQLVIITSKDTYKTGDQVHFEGRYFGMASRRTADGVSYPIHMFTTDNDI